MKTTVLAALLALACGSVMSSTVRPDSNAMFKLGSHTCTEIAEMVESVGADMLQAIRVNNEVSSQKAHFSAENVVAAAKRLEMLKQKAETVSQIYTAARCGGI